jgi:HD-GYP domain-containing protein (c-di-GMP phosphodiesterase class II)
MQQLSTSSITQGQRLDQALFLPNGQKLLNAGVVITQRHLSILANLSDPTLYLAKSLDELVQAGVVARMESQRMRVGEKAQRDVLSAGGTLLLASGDQIEQHHLDAMAEGAFGTTGAGNDSHVESAQEAARLRKERMLMADASVEQIEAEAASLKLKVEPQAESLALPKMRGSVAWPGIEALSTWREQRVATIRLCFGRIEAGLPLEVAALQAVVDDLFELLITHPESFTQLALLCPRRQNYLPDHACCVTVLAMACALQLRWPEADVRRLALGGILFDIGMLMIPERIRIGGCQLSEVDRNRVQRHPGFSVAMTECITGIEPLVKLAALQHHERDTGMGYPRGLRRERICDDAKLLAICDVFAAASSPRGYHQPKLPYLVMEEIIRSAAAGIFDKQATRALVSATGLFPVGSHVMLSDRTTACVISANPTRVDRPVVRLHDPRTPAGGKVIALAEIHPDQLSVLRAIPNPTTEQTV